MPCGKAGSYKCVEDCFCIPSDGTSNTCLCQNEGANFLHCNCLYGDECKCYEVCPCGPAQRQPSGNTCVECSCVPLEKSSSVCNTETCGCSAINLCSCKGSSAQKPGDGKGLCLSNSSPGVCVCNAEKNIKSCRGCEVSGTKEMENELCVSGTNCNGQCKCKGNASSCVCLCKNKEGEYVCCDDCQCDENNKCDKDGCCCVPKEVKTETKASKSYVHNESVKSCFCVCKDKGGEVVCCDENNKCNKVGCSCVPKETMTVTGEVKSCVRYKDASSCICVCKNEKGEVVCCDDCKCDENNICDIEGCSCVPKETKPEAEASKSCIHNENVKSCLCVCKNEEGEVVCCSDCKCDDKNKCDKEGCSCVPKEVKSVTEASKSYVHNKTVKSCICVCKNEGETICCEDCKCDEDNICTKEGCTCLRPL